MNLTLFVSVPILLAVCLLVFGGLSRLFPCNPGQPSMFSRPIATDLVYGVAGMILYGSLIPAGVALALAAAFGPGASRILDQAQAGGGRLAAMPVWIQVVLLLAVTDLVQYWLHRALHGRTLWKFHEIHHGAEEVNWTTTFRIHPVNYLLYTTTLAVAARMAGFSPQVFVIVAPLVFFMGALAHANLNWTFGPLRYVIASPVFHRWHHTDAQATRDSNFAPLFPVWDLMFGTFHMPAGERPAGYGVAGSPRDIPSQLLRPFQPKKLAIAPRPEARA